MPKNNDTKYAVGYGKPPRATQFKPGQSGNPHGRPKRIDDVGDVLRKELSARIAIVKDGKRQRTTMLRAIIKQNLNKAANGDSKALAILFNALKFYRPDVGDNLELLIQEFRATHARNLASDAASGDLDEKPKQEDEPK